MSYNSPLDRGSLPRIDYRASTGAVDPGLRLYMLRVYNFMAAGLGLTGLVAYVAVATGFYQHIAGTPLIWTALEVAFRKTRALQQRRYGDAAPAEGRYRAAGGKARYGGKRARCRILGHGRAPNAPICCPPSPVSQPSECCLAACRTGVLLIANILISLQFYVRHEKANCN